MSNNRPIVSVTNLSKAFDGFVVFKNADFSIEKGEKIGLVGANGSGKSTLLKILSGLAESDEGGVLISPDVSIGYIPQDFELHKEQMVSDFLGLNLNGDEGNQEVAINNLPQVLSVFSKLMLDPTVLERTVEKLSGGEKTKVALARIFLARDDFLLLDEPTNNLDICGLELLEDFVKESKKTFLIVSHDREFLDRTVGRMFEIDEVDRKLRIYEGDFSSYMEARRARIEREWSLYNESVDEKRRLENAVEERLRRADEISRSKPRDSDKLQRSFKIERGEKAASRSAMLLKKRLENTESVERPKSRPPLVISFETDSRSGDKVLELVSLLKKIGDKQIGPLDLSINFGDRVLISGENGSGKTTLLKMIMGQVGVDGGEIKYGTNLNIGYLPQEEDLVSSATVRDEFMRHVKIEESEGRTILNQFKLSADDVKKKVGELSSGERSRLILAMIVAKKPNLIILDEPSNHLDLEVLESLETAIKDFEGTLIVVSHDRYFIKRIQPVKIFAIQKTAHLA